MERAVKAKFKSSAVLMTGVHDGNRIERDTLRRVTWRIMPLLTVTYIVAWLDRVNVGFAALQMNHDLGFSAAVYGFGAGIFFIGYSLCEIPSNLALCRFGARRWIARIMITWGLLSASMIFVRSSASFYVMRFLIGVAEAGFFPGIIFYLARWYPEAQRAKAIGWFMVAVPLASMVGGPIAGLLLDLGGKLGLAGWQWLFVAEGVPAVLLAWVVLRYLPEEPSAARWLPPAGREWLTGKLQKEQTLCDERHHVSLRETLKHPIVWRLGVINFLAQMGTYGLTLWLPQIIKTLSGMSDLRVGFYSGLPYVAAALAMIFVGAHSDRSGERCWHIALSFFFAAFGFLASGFVQSTSLMMLALTAVAMGTHGRNGPFWALPCHFLSGRAAAVGIALVNSVGSLGGFVGPYAIGVAKSATGTFVGGQCFLAIALLLAGALSLRLRRAEALRPVLVEQAHVPPRMPYLSHI
jgi:ACS family tartrate transporter-like MFS transporter